MKKKYISPNQKVHVLSSVSHLMENTAVETGDDVTSETTSEQNPLEGDARQSGSNNIWDNEW